MEARLFVGNLSYKSTEEGQWGLFMQAANMNSVALIKEPGIQRSRGFAFVEMGSPNDVQKTISMFDGYALDERRMSVSVTRLHEERGSSSIQQQRSHRDNHNNRRY